MSARAAPSPLGLGLTRPAFCVRKAAAREDLNQMTDIEKRPAADLPTDLLENAGQRKRRLRGLMGAGKTSIGAEWPCALGIALLRQRSRDRECVTQ